MSHTFSTIGGTLANEYEKYIACVVSSPDYSALPTQSLTR